MREIRARQFEVGIEILHLQLTLQRATGTRARLTGTGTHVHAVGPFLVLQIQRRIDAAFQFERCAAPGSFAGCEQGSTFILVALAAANGQRHVGLQHGFVKLQSALGHVQPVDLRHVVRRLLLVLLRRKYPVADTFVVAFQNQPGLIEGDVGKLYLPAQQWPQ